MRRCRTSPEQLRQLVVNLAVEMQGAFSNESLSAAEAEERVMELMRDVGREALGQGLSEKYDAASGGTGPGLQRGALRDGPGDAGAIDRDRDLR